MRSLVGALVVLVLAAGIAAAATREPDHDPHDRLPPLPSDRAAAVTTTTAGQPAIVPADDQAFVSGRADHVTVDDAVVDPIPTPLTVTTPERGLGAGARIEGALVGGQPATIQWDAGTPFVLRGAGGGLATDPVHVEIGPSGAVVRLDGAVHGFVPGRYELDSPVAVGRSGLATPQDTVTFDATEQTTIEFTGNATVPLPGERWVLKGPGRLDAQGDFSVRTASGRGERSHVRFGEGAFELTVSRVDGSLQLQATVQGPLSSS
jgi:hypothetical protein